MEMTKEQADQAQRLLTKAIRALESQSASDAQERSVRESCARIVRFLDVQYMDMNDADVEGVPEPDPRSGRNRTERWIYANVRRTTADTILRLADMVESPDDGCPW